MQQMIKFIFLNMCFSIVHFQMAFSNCMYFFFFLRRNYMYFMHGADYIIVCPGIIWWVLKCAD